MKKLLLSFLVAFGAMSAANAQLPSGTVFPNFTTVDIHGNPVDLYTYLNAGKTVFIDISATWCHPCWLYHETHALDSLWAHHGPTGAPGVSATTTNDVVVIFVQGEPTSGLAELTNNVWGTGAVTSGGTYATFTQGDWTAQTSYIIIDDSTLQGPRNTTWNIAYFPTVYMICQDHIVTELTQPTESEAYAAVAATCPAYGPSSTVDVKATAYTGQGYYFCNATPSVSFQNYSTNTLTSATITVKDATGTVVHTQPWTGSLAPYAVTSTPLTSFAGTSFGGYKYSVTATGDTHTANDASVDSVFKVYAPANAATVPYSESFGAATLSYKYYFPDPNGYAFVSNTLNNPASPGTSVNIIGPSGSADTALWFDCHDASGATPALNNYAIDFIFGNYKIVPNTHLTFDESYAEKSGVTSGGDILQIMVSKDCGNSWTPAWTATGSALTSGAPSITSNWFVPSAGSQWKHVDVNLTADTSADLMIKVEGVSAASANTGELIFVDNLNLSVVTSSVSQVAVTSDINIFPNPAKDLATVHFSLPDAATVMIQVTDALGRTVNVINQELNAGVQNIDLNTASLPTGLYNVKIAAGSTITTKQLSVIK
jgi:type IX secretion system substrate protein